MGVLYARVGGAWVPVVGNDEVWVAADPPTDAGVELWYDTDDPGLSVGSLSRLVGVRQATATSYTTTLSTYTDITVTTGQQPLMNLALDTSRWYRATLIVMGRCTVAPVSRMIFGLFGGATQLQEDLLPAPAVVNSASTYIAEFIFKPVVATAVDYKMACRTDGAATTIQLVPSAASPMTFMIEDLGVGA